MLLLRRADSSCMGGKSERRRSRCRCQNCSGNSETWTEEREEKVEEVREKER